MSIKPQNTRVTLDVAEQDFVRLALQSLGSDPTEVQAGCFVLEIPDSARARFENATSVNFRLAPSADMRVLGVEEPKFDECPLLTTESALWVWIVEMLGREDGILDTRPVYQPTRVHEISQKLFAAYHVQGGNMHLAGCTLEERPILRLSLWTPHSDSRRLIHCYLTPEGERLSEEQILRLGLDQLTVRREPPRIVPEELRIWRQQAEAICLGDAGSSEVEIISTAVVWCKHADGKVAFEIGNGRGEVGFSAWAKPLVDGVDKPTPFYCPATDRSSYRLAATEDGRISVEEGIATCEATRQRVLETELDTCSATGKRVCRSLLTVCPVTRSRVQKGELLSCSMCQQQVSPTAIKEGRCQACRNLQQVSKDDPLLARILGEHPKLDRRGRWRIAETERVYIVTASALWRRLLLVIDKESLDLIRIAECNRLARRWVDAPPIDQNDLA